MKGVRLDMNRVCLLALVFSLLLSPLVHATGIADAPESELRSVTLYAPLKYKDDRSKTLFSFKTGQYVRGLDDWDLIYGSLYIGDDWDWFSVSTARNARSAFRDLGQLSWTDSFTVPVIQPFPKLKEGEERTFRVDSSGADGADGADGAPGADGADADGVVRPKPRPPVSVDANKPSRKPKHDGVPKVDPIFVKAIVGHLYVLRVVDDENDFYVLFRVEALERGDNCTISWKQIPAPVEVARNY